MKKLRRYVEDHDHAIRIKAEIMVDDFHRRVLAPRLVGGEARAMVVAGSVDRALGYFRAISAYLVERKSPWRAIVAFSGEREFDGETVSERRSTASRPGGSPKSSGKTRSASSSAPTSSRPATTSRSSRPCMWTSRSPGSGGADAVAAEPRPPEKTGAFVLDFANDADAIRAAFEPYYRTTILFPTRPTRTASTT